MATIKSYTDINQSKVLATILPLESADMFWMKDLKDFYEVVAIPYSESGADKDDGLPCWSLAALLGVLPALGNKHAVFGTSIKESKWHVLYHNIDTLFLEDSGLYDNLIDACYEMILKLHELKIL